MDNCPDCGVELQYLDQYDSFFCPQCKKEVMLRAPDGTTDIDTSEISTLDLDVVDVGENTIAEVEKTPVATVQSVQEVSISNSDDILEEDDPIVPVEPEKGSELGTISKVLSEINDLLRSDDISLLKDALDKLGVPESTVSEQVSNLAESSGEISVCNSVIENSEIVQENIMSVSRVTRNYAVSLSENKQTEGGEILEKMKELTVRLGRLRTGMGELDNMEGKKMERLNHLSKEDSERLGQSSDRDSVLDRAHDLILDFSERYRKQVRKNHELARQIREIDILIENARKRNALPSGGILS